MTNEAQKRIVDLISSFGYTKKEDIKLISNYRVASYILDTVPFNYISNIPIKDNQRILHLGQFMGHDYVIDYDMKYSDLRFIISTNKYKKRELNLENLLENTHNVLEKSIELSQYI